MISPSLVRLQSNSLCFQDLEFHGVVRFFFQGGIGASVITKCIRVSSTATTREVIDVLIEKFRPDMRMLSQHKYGLYEVHVNGGKHFFVLLCKDRMLALVLAPVTWRRFAYLRVVEGRRVS